MVNSIASATRNKVINNNKNIIKREVKSITDIGIDMVKTNIKNMIGREFVIGMLGQIDWDTRIKALAWLENLDKKTYNKYSHTTVVNKNENNPYEIRPKRFLKDDVNFIMRKDNCFIQVKTRKEKYDEDSATFQTLTVFIFGKDSNKYIKDFKKYINSKNKNDENSLYCMDISSNTSLARSGYITRVAGRDFSTIFIDHNKKNKIINFIESWQKNGDIFNSRGISYKTGILLHGTRGTGKTSISKAIATHLNALLVKISTNALYELDNAVLKSSLDGCHSETNTIVIAIDEIDAVTINRENKEEYEGSGMMKNKALLNLLSILDGIDIDMKIIFVCTTNFYDRLGEDIKRDGRFDLTLEIGNINETIATEMCNSFNVDVKNILTDNELISNNINPANLQNRIIQHIYSKMK